MYFFTENSISAFASIGDDGSVPLRGHSLSWHSANHNPNIRNTNGTLSAKVWVPQFDQPGRQSKVQGENSAHLNSNGNAVLE